MGKPAKQISSPRPNVFLFHDYRGYLNEQLKWWKECGSELSLRRVATSCGVSAPFLSMILKGHKNIPLSLLEKLVPLIGLKEDEAQYLRLLIVVSDSNDQQERIEAFGKIQNFRVYRSLNPQETEVFQYMTKWYYVAIRELTLLPDFKLDPHWIQEKLCFQVPIREIQKALDFLQEQKLIEVDKSGKVVARRKDLHCTGGVYKLALTQYYKQIYSLAYESIEKIHRDQRYMMGDTLAIPQNQFEEFKKIVDECFKRIVDLKRKEGETDSVYHIGFFGFPLASSKKEVA